MQINIQLPGKINYFLKQLDFLDYRTEVRNLAYQLQYLELNLELLNVFSHGSIRSSIIRQLIIMFDNIIEYLLFVALCQVYGKAPNNDKVPSLIGQAVKKKIINGTLAGKLNRLNEMRNKLHPGKQPNDLEIHCFNIDESNFCKETFEELFEKLLVYFPKKA